MAKRSGFKVICTLDDGRKIAAYLEPLHSKALRFIWNETKKSGCVYPQEIAHALRPYDYPSAPPFHKDQYFKFENGKAYGLKKISEIVNEFKPVIRSLGDQDINDPFPLRKVDDPEHEYTFVEIFYRITQIDFIPIRDESTKE